MNDLAINGATLGAESIVLRSTAALNDVHSYALTELSKLEDMITQIKHAVELQKNKSQQEITVYIELVNDALRVSKDIEGAVRRISGSLEAQ